MKQKKRLLTLLALACTLTSGLAFSSCKEDSGSSAQPTQIELVYREYVADAEENGQTPLSYEQWLESIKGDKGEDGEDGVGIEKVEYDENGDLKITFTDGSTQTVAMPEKEEGTYGLQYQRIAGKDEYRVVGIGIAAELDIVIPDTYNGLPVTEIAEKAFNVGLSPANAHLTSITIGNNVTTIGQSAFYKCSSLKSVVVGDSATLIGNYAFYNCTSLTSIEIPDGVTTIGDSAFDGCSSLTSIEIPDGVTTIGASAFDSCSSLTSIEIPDSVTSIGDRAFEDCSSLISVEIGESVTAIGGSTFSSCERLTSIEIPDSVTSIGWCAFYYCEGLTSVTIGDGVTSIEDAAFSSCYKLLEVYNKSSLNIRKGSSTYGEVAYYAKAVYTEPYTSKLSTDENGYILYTDGDVVSLVGYVGTETDLILANNITEIYQYAFYNCDGLTSITFEGTMAEWNAIEKGSRWNYNIPMTEVVCSDGTVAI